MQRYLSLRKKVDINRVFLSKKKAFNESFTIYYRNNNLNHPRFCFAISKKYGKANKRNLLKRRLKAIIEANQNDFEKSYDIVISVKPSVCDYDFYKIRKRFLSLLRKINVLKDKAYE